MPLVSWGFLGVWAGGQASPAQTLIGHGQAMDGSGQQSNQGLGSTFVKMVERTVRCANPAVMRAPPLDLR